jgi:hypothetical protein
VKIDGWADAAAAQAESLAGVERYAAAVDKPAF